MTVLSTTVGDAALPLLKPGQARVGFEELIPATNTVTTEQLYICYAMSPKIKRNLVFFFLHARQDVL